LLLQQIISYDSSRGGVSVITEKGETTTSFLLIQRAKSSDTGKYTCNPSNAQPKSIMVHVLNGEDSPSRSHFSTFSLLQLPHRMRCMSVPMHAALGFRFFAPAFSDDKIFLPLCCDLPPALRLLCLRLGGNCQLVVNYSLAT
jgi:hypothetical protein